MGELRPADEPVPTRMSLRAERGNPVFFLDCRVAVLLAVTPGDLVVCVDGGIRVDLLLLTYDIIIAKLS